MDNEEVIAPTTLELKKLFDELREQLVKLAYKQECLQAENEQLKRKLKQSGAINH